MNINHMKAFLEVARSGSFQVAADNLHITQSTVSARIKVLEDQLNTSLFNRKRDGSKLTTSGHHFIRYATTSVRAWEQAKQEIALPEELDAMISLGVQLNLWQQITPLWIDQMQNNAPEVGTRVVMDYSDSLLRQLIDGELDLALTYVNRQQSELRTELLFEDTLVLVATKPREVQQGWIKDYVFVDWGNEFREAHAMVYPDTQAPRLSVGLGMTGLDYILNYGGAAYFPERMIEKQVKEGRLFFVKHAQTFNRPVYLSYPKEPINAELLEMARKNLQQVLHNPLEEESLHFIRPEIPCEEPV
ncbi:LysR family transcriptional regulator [Amphritea sp. 1_MG-2023]|uniref:LysR family transcriptional regulator n=1 Tax=Amphritea sp. 1_MG-2023 TaxID=3062670 RepID=UPI0026E22CF8|nr:LysR family transcriptional regulator [Amphritea sp. 1_MG-2023]MDO6563338.1 LysR family transcriptional regulator [Amphritea sp. 1_MG-2023]